MKKTFLKIYLLIVCGLPKKRGNYSRFWGKGEDDNWIFEAGIFRSLIIDFIDRGRGQWASRPIARLLEKNEERKKCKTRINYEDK